MILDRNLILFTQVFPYGIGESFLEEEIKYLSNNFKTVTIVTSKKSIKKRILPDNAKVVFCNDYNGSNVNKLKHFIKLFFSLFLSEVLRFKNWKYFLKRTNINYLINSTSNASKIYTFLMKYIDNKNKTFDSLYLYTYWWLDESIAIALLKKKHPKIKAFTRCHGYDVYFERAKGKYLPYKYFTLKYLDRVFPISKNAINYIENNYPLSNYFPNKLSLSQLGVIEGSLSLEKTGDKDVFTIVSCSQIYPNKRLELIYNSIIKLNYKVKWIHLGSYIENFSEDYYEELIKNIKVSPENIEIDFKGKLLNFEILDFYKKNYIDLFINLSYSEGLPVSIMEAMSYSIPALATNVGGVSELVNDDNGILVARDSIAEEITSDILKFLELNTNLVIEKRKAAYNTWINKFNSKINYNKFINEINNL
jgi:glycosyltransferase involved in cell wall biosynthesis